jgi:hypothetical protein
MHTAHLVRILPLGCRITLTLKDIPIAMGYIFYMDATSIIPQPIFIYKKPVWIQIPRKSYRGGSSVVTVWPKAVARGGCAPSRTAEAKW